MRSIPVTIEKVLELKGVYRSFNFPSFVYAHISTPVSIQGQCVQYALLATAPQHGIMLLGEIDPLTNCFEHYDAKGPYAVYTRAGNGVVNQVSVPREQLTRLKTLEEILCIDGISVTRTLVPT